jgi:aerobic carbon-monoxide dehydrogenase large subunit
MSSYIGQSLKRFEDPRLLKGQGTFVDDMQLPGMLHAVVVRSPHAHARIQSIDAASAQALPGVITVLTARELAGNVRNIPRRVVPDLDEVDVPEHPVLATDRVCYVGQPVAVVVAEARGVAEDAADALQIAYDPLPPVLNLRDAAEDTSTLLHDEMGTNVALPLQLGRGDIEVTFARADRIVRGRYEVPRISAAPMECRGLVAQYRHGRRGPWLPLETGTSARTDKIATQPTQSGKGIPLGVLLVDRPSLLADGTQSGWLSGPLGGFLGQPPKDSYGVRFFPPLLGCDRFSFLG